jgi:hypothetical protein
MAVAIERGQSRLVSLCGSQPSNVSWLGFTEDQAELLDFLDHLGNNGWARNSQTDALMPRVLGDCEEAGLTVACVTEAMMSGYGRHALHQLDRWESKRTTGRYRPLRQPQFDKIW